MTVRIKTEFLCKCKDQLGYASPIEATKPCPSCGRVYKAMFGDGKIKVVELNPNHLKNCFLVICQELRIDKLCEWLNNKLKEVNNSERK